MINDNLVLYLDYNKAPCIIGYNWLCYNILTIYK